jgi:hypothetical protein
MNVLVVVVVIVVVVIVVVVIVSNSLNKGTGIGDLAFPLHFKSPQFCLIGYSIR